MGTWGFTILFSLLCICLKVSITKKFKKSYNLDCSDSDSYISENQFDHANTQQRQAALRTEIWDGQSQEGEQIGAWATVRGHEVLAGVEKCVRGREFEWSGDNLKVLGEKTGSVGRGEAECNRDSCPPVRSPLVCNLTRLQSSLYCNALCLPQSPQVMSLFYFTH